MKPAAAHPKEASGVHRADPPKVSVVTPSLNQAPFLEDTMRSVLGQDYADIEYVVIDGASTDGSADIIRSYEERLDYWVSEPDQGQVEAINKGFATTNGDILTWLNSDDVYLSPHVVTEVVSYFERYPTVHAVSGAGAILAEQGHWLRQIEIFPRHAHYQKLRLRNCILQPATFFNRRALESCPLDDSLDFAFDWDFFIRLTRDFNLMVVDDVWAGYRMWGHNKTAVGSAARAREQAEVLRRHVGRLSWQYWTVKAFQALYGTVERLPHPLQPRLRSAVRFLSRSVALAGFRRVPIV